MDSTPFAETRAARLCSWIPFAAASVYSAWAFLRIFATRDAFHRFLEDLGAQPSALFLLVTHPLFLWAIPAAVLIGFTKEILIRNKTRTMIWNGTHLILILLLFSLYYTGLLQFIVDLVETMSGGYKPK